MKKFVFFLFVIQLIVQDLSAQKPELFIKSGDKGLYIEHKVESKESFFSVGRLYNVSPKFIASYNKLELNKGLRIDQKIRIPLSDTNFTRTGNSGAPVYYKVKDKEDLARISAGYINVPVSDLMRWNNLTGVDLKEGKKLIVGFLLGSKWPAVTIKEKSDPEKIVLEKPAEKVAEKPVEIINKEPVAKIETPVPVEPVKMDDTGEGYFKSIFAQQVKVTPAVKTETVTSGIFKTISGWSDAKYYMLKDKVQPGTIVKVINPENNKAVYAKVLGEMSGIRQNEGLDIRISNSAASVLQVKDQDKFILKINY